MIKLDETHDAVAAITAAWRNEIEYLTPPPIRPGDIATDPDYAEIATRLADCEIAIKRLEALHARYVALVDALSPTPVRHHEHRSRRRAHIAEPPAP